ncbi:unnamed protein product [Boreogadus saida]
MEERRAALSPNLLILRNRAQLIHTPPPQVCPGPGQRDTAHGAGEVLHPAADLLKNTGNSERPVINDGVWDELTETREDFEEEGKKRAGPIIECKWLVLPLPETRLVLLLIRCHQITSRDRSDILIAEHTIAEIKVTSSWQPLHIESSSNIPLDGHSQS